MISCRHISDNISAAGRYIGSSNIWKIREFWNFRRPFVEYYRVSRRPGRYLETFLEPVALFCQSTSPWRAMATPFMPKITEYYRTLVSQITDFPNSFSISDFLTDTLRGLDPSKKMHIDCPHLQKGGYGGSISHQRLIFKGILWVSGGLFF